MQFEAVSLADFQVAQFVIGQLIHPMGSYQSKTQTRHPESAVLTIIESFMNEALSLMIYNVHIYFVSDERLCYTFLFLFESQLKR